MYNRAEGGGKALFCILLFHLFWYHDNHQLFWKLWLLFVLCFLSRLKLGGVIGLLDELGNGVGNRVGGQHGVDTAGSRED